MYMHDVLVGNFMVLSTGPYSANMRQWQSIECIKTSWYSYLYLMKYLYFIKDILFYLQVKFLACYIIRQWLHIQWKQLPDTKYLDIY